jgi:hypothetical protein
MFTVHSLLGTILDLSSSIAVEEILFKVFPDEVLEVSNLKFCRTPFRWIVVFVFQGTLERGKYILCNALNADFSAVDQARSSLSSGLETD